MRAVPVARLERTRLKDDAPSSGYPWDLPAVRSIDGLDLTASVTVLVGDNGTGKSTIVEAIAVATGFGSEGGSIGFSSLPTRSTVSALADGLIMSWTAGQRRGWFLRAESFYDIASRIEDDWRVAEAFGDHSFHGQSHGESFLAIADMRMRGPGIYILDEPEAALSFQGCLRLLRIIHDGVADGAQFIIATHSPLLMAFPSAAIVHFDGDGLRAAGFDELPVVLSWRSFLEAPDRYLRHLLNDDD